MKKIALFFGIFINAMTLTAIQTDTKFDEHMLLSQEEFLIDNLIALDEALKEPAPEIEYVVHLLGNVINSPDICFKIDDAVATFTSYVDKLRILKLVLKNPAVKKHIRSLIERIFEVSNQDRADEEFINFAVELSKFNFKLPDNKLKKAAHFAKKIIKNNIPTDLVQGYVHPKMFKNSKYFLTLMGSLVYKKSSYAKIFGDSCTALRSMHERELCRLILLSAQEGTLNKDHALLAHLDNFGLRDTPVWDKALAQFHLKMIDKLEKKIKQQNQILNSAQSDSFFELIKKPEECPICWEETVDLKKMNCCQYYLCQNCLLIHVKLKSKDNQLIPCVNPYCKQYIDVDTLRTLNLPSKEFLIFNIRILHEKIISFQGKPCQNSTCPDAFWREETIEIVAEPFYNAKKIRTANDSFDYVSLGSYIKCPTCGLLQCFDCGFNHPSMTCAQMKNVLEKSEKWEKQIITGMNSKYKPCPQCQAVIEKNEGCNHMTCTNCKHEFFWTTLEPYRKRELHSN